MFLHVSAKTILVEVRLSEQDNKGRYRFTLAHELAHWILHKEMILSDNTEAAFIDGVHDTRMEKQADYFASALLIPMGTVKKYYYSLFGKGCSRSDLIAAMAERFQVSKQALGIFERSAEEKFFFKLEAEALYMAMRKLDKVSIRRFYLYYNACTFRSRQQSPSLGITGFDIDSLSDSDISFIKFRILSVYFCAFPILI